MYGFFFSLILNSMRTILALVTNCYSLDHVLLITPLPDRVSFVKCFALANFQVTVVVLLFLVAWQQQHKKRKTCMWCTWRMGKMTEH